MKPFSYKGEILGEDRKIFFEPRCYIAASHSASNQTTSQKTLTTSGATSPISGGPGAAASSGSIAVGQGGNYQESGSLNLTGANVGGVGGSINANGSTVNIGDQNAVQQLSQLANTFAQTVQGVASDGSGGGGTVIIPATSSATATIPWTALGLIAAAIAAIFVLGQVFKKS